MELKKTIYLSKKTPRPQSVLASFPLYKGIKISYFFGYFALVGFTFSFISFSYLLLRTTSSEFFYKILLVEIIFCLVWIPMLLFLFNAKKIRHQRINAILFGKFVKGKIIDKKPLIRIFLLKIEVTKPNGTTDIVEYNIEQDPLLYTNVKIGESFVGLWNQKNNTYFFPFEINLEVAEKN